MLQLVNPRWPASSTRAGAHNSKTKTRRSVPLLGIGDLFLVVSMMVVGAYNGMIQFRPRDAYFLPPEPTSLRIVRWLNDAGRIHNAAADGETGIRLAVYVWGSLATVVVAQLSLLTHTAVSWPLMPVWLRAKSAVMLVCISLSFFRYGWGAGAVALPLPLVDNTCLFIAHSACTQFCLLTTTTIVLGYAYPNSLEALERDERAEVSSLLAWLGIAANKPRNARNDVADDSAHDTELLSGFGSMFSAKDLRDLVTPHSRTGAGGARGPSGGQSIGGLPGSGGGRRADRTPVGICGSCICPALRSCCFYSFCCCCCTPRRFSDGSAKPIDCCWGRFALRACGLVERVVSLFVVGCTIITILMMTQLPQYFRYTWSPLIGHVSMLCAVFGFMGVVALGLQRGRRLLQAAAADHIQLGPRIIGAWFLQDVVIPGITIAVLVYAWLLQQPEGCPDWARSGTGLTYEEAPLPVGITFPDGLDESNPDTRQRVTDSLRSGAAFSTAFAIVILCSCIAIVFQTSEAVAQRLAQDSITATRTLQRAIGAVSHAARGPLNSAALSLALLQRTQLHKRASVVHHDLPQVRIFDEEDAAMDESADSSSSVKQRHTSTSHRRQQPMGSITVPGDGVRGALPTMLGARKPLSPSQPSERLEHQPPASSTMASQQPVPIGSMTFTADVSDGMDSDPPSPVVDMTERYAAPQEGSMVRASAGEAETTAGTCNTVDVTDWTKTTPEAGGSTVNQSSLLEQAQDRQNSSGDASIVSLSPLSPLPREAIGEEADDEADQSRGRVRGATLQVDTKEASIAAGAGAGSFDSATSPFSMDLSRHGLLQELRVSIQESKRQLDNLLLWEKTSGGGFAVDAVPWSWKALDAAWVVRVVSGFQASMEAAGATLRVALEPVKVLTTERAAPSTAFARSWSHWSPTADSDSKQPSTDDSAVSRIEPSAAVWGGAAVFVPMEPHPAAIAPSSAVNDTSSGFGSDGPSMPATDSASTLVGTHSDRAIAGGAIAGGAVAAAIQNGLSDVVEADNDDSDTDGPRVAPRMPNTAPTNNTPPAASGVRRDQPQARQSGALSATGSTGRQIDGDAEAVGAVWGATRQTPVVRSALLGTSPLDAHRRVGSAAGSRAAPSRGTARTQDDAGSSLVVGLHDWEIHADHDRLKALSSALIASAMARVAALDRHSLIRLRCTLCRSAEAALSLSWPAHTPDPPLQDVQRYLEHLATTAGGDATSIQGSAVGGVLGTSGARDPAVEEVDPETLRIEDDVLRLAARSSSRDTASRKRLKVLRRLIRAGYRLATLQIECDDDGTGFSRAVVESGKLFEPFADLEVVAADTTGTASGGYGETGGGLGMDEVGNSGPGGVGTSSATRQSGLGLSIVKSIACEQMRGEVGLASRMLQGTAVWVRVPVWIRPRQAPTSEDQDGIGALDCLGDWLRFGSTVSEDENVERFEAASRDSSDDNVSESGQDDQSASPDDQQLHATTHATTAQHDKKQKTKPDKEALQEERSMQTSDDLPIAHRRRLVSNCSGNHGSVEGRADTSQSDVTGAIEGFTPAGAAIVVSGTDGAHTRGLGEELRAEASSTDPPGHRTSLDDRRPLGMGFLQTHALSSSPASANQRTVGGTNGSNTVTAAEARRGARHGTHLLGDAMLAESIATGASASDLSGAVERYPAVGQAASPLGANGVGIGLITPAAVGATETARNPQNAWGATAASGVSASAIDSLVMLGGVSSASHAARSRENPSRHPDSISDNGSSGSATTASAARQGTHHHSSGQPSAFVQSSASPASPGRYQSTSSRAPTGNGSESGGDASSGSYTNSLVRSHDRRVVEGLSAIETSDLDHRSLGAYASADVLDTHHVVGQGTALASLAEVAASDSTSDGELTANNLVSASAGHAGTTSRSLRRSRSVPDSSMRREIAATATKPTIVVEGAGRAISALASAPVAAGVSSTSSSRSRGKSTEHVRTGGGAACDTDESTGSSSKKSRGRSERRTREERRARRHEKRSQSGSTARSRGSASSARGLGRSTALAHVSVMLADDDASTRTLLGAVLRRRLGAQDVTAFSDGRPMMDRLQELIQAGDGASLPAILFVDNRMPILGAEGVLRELTGLRVIGAASATAPGLDVALAAMRVIVITGDADGATKARMMGLGAHAVLTKPLEADDLARTIKLMRLPASGT